MGGTPSLGEDTFHCAFPRGSNTSAGQLSRDWASSLFRARDFDTADLGRRFWQPRSRAFPRSPPEKLVIQNCFQTKPLTSMRLCSHLLSRRLDLTTHFLPYWSFLCGYSIFIAGKRPLRTYLTIWALCFSIYGRKYYLRMKILLYLLRPFFLGGVEEYRL